MKDKYDEAIEYLTANPHDIFTAWLHPIDSDRDEIKQAHCLFAYVAATRSDKSYESCGCLTQIRGAGYVAVSHGEEVTSLTEEIRRDERIPASAPDGSCPAIAVADLPVFAEWQRRLDKELGR